MSHLTMGAVITLIVLAACLPVRAQSSAIRIYAHGFAKQIKWTSNGNLIPVNETTSFTQDDPLVVAYAQAEFYSANLTWQWYDPNGQLYQNTTSQYQCVTSPCYIDAGLAIQYTPVATMFGLWRMNLLADGLQLYSDTFSINSVLLEDNYWNFNIEQSATSQISASLTVTIHPDNQTWSSYYIFLPYATNVTASELNTNRALNVTASSKGLVVEFPGPRSDGYSFVINFDFGYGFNLVNLNGLTGGVFAFTWLDWPWQRGNFPNYHPVYETFTITLPKGGELLDAIGQNTQDLNYSLTSGTGQSIHFATTLLTQMFGWTIIYKDLTYANAHPNVQSLRIENEPGAFNFVSAQSTTLLPLSVGSLNVWAAIMSILLLTSSELASPLYSRAGFSLLVDRKRLRVAALVLVVLFLALMVYQVISSPQILVAR